MLKKYDRTHLTILTEGMKLMTEKGFDNVGILDICKASSVSRPSFYIHFRSKEHLLSEYIESTEFLTKDLIKWVEYYPNALDRLFRLLMAYMRHLHLITNVELFSHYMAFRILEGEDSYSKNRNAKMSELMIPYIRQGQRERLIGNQADPYHLCKSVLLLFDGSLYDWCVTFGKSDHERTFFWNLEEVLQVVDPLRGLWKMEENFPPDALLLKSLEELYGAE